MDFFISPAMADGATAQSAASPGLMDFAFPVVLLVLFYFMLIRPQSKRAKLHREMQTALAKGDEVVTDGGLMGKIMDIGDNAVTLQLAENIEVKVRQEAISSVMPKGTLKKL